MSAWYANVQPLALDLPDISGAIVDVIDETTVITFSQSRFIVHDAFADYYQRIDGEHLLGWPTSPEYQLPDVEPPVYVQHFLYGAIRFSEQTNAFVHMPVVWQSTVQSNLVTARQPLQLR